MHRLASCAPFKRRVPAHFSGCCGPLWKHSTNALQLVLRAPLKAENLHIAVANGAPFESKVLTLYSCCWGPLQKQSIYALQWLLEAPLKVEYLPMQFLLVDPLKAAHIHKSCCWGSLESKVLMCDMFRNILYQWTIRFSPKMRNIYARNPAKGVFRKGVRVKCLFRLPLNTPRSVLEDLLHIWL